MPKKSNPYKPGTNNWDLWFKGFVRVKSKANRKEIIEVKDVEEREKAGWSIDKADLMDDRTELIWLLVVFAIGVMATIFFIAIGDTKTGLGISATSSFANLHSIVTRHV